MEAKRKNIERGIIEMKEKIMNFLEERTKNEVGYTTLSRNQIMEKLGMEHTIHDTRHTFATMISDVSDNESAITGIIGHTNINMTKKYTHTSIEKMRKEMEKIN